MSAVNGLIFCSIVKEHLPAKSVGARQLVSYKPSFLADAMLGSVARKLRIFGFDTLYIKHIHDDEVLKIGIQDNRVILTCDKELFKRIVRAGAPGVLLKCSDDFEDIVHILSKYEITSVSFDTMNSRCSVCNGLLVEEKRINIKRHIPPKVVKSHKEFFKCTKCNKIYWDGSHLTRIRSLSRNIDTKIKKMSEKKLL
jgi:uncharacterized protein